VRGHRVVFDSDLATLYGVPTKGFNQAIKRNRLRFPKDFAFQLTAKEADSLRSQNVTINDTAEPSTDRRGRHRKYLPWVFTEHGAVMAANVLRSPKAIQMSVYVVRAFVAQREALASNQKVLRRLAEIDKTLLEHDAALRTLWNKLRPLLLPPPDQPAREIGFHTRLPKR
jgi:hypothetical protein